MTQFKSFGWSCLLGTLVLSLTACPKFGMDDKAKTDKDAGERGSTDGVDNDKDATDLTDDEAQRVCESVMPNQSRDLQCTVMAVHGSPSMAACEEAKQRCLATVPSAPDAERCARPEAADALSNCAGVSVGEIKDCFAEGLALEARLTCADAGKRIEPPACARALAMRCPMLFDGDRQDGEGPPDDFDGGVSHEGERRPPEEGGDHPNIDPQACMGEEVDASGVDCAAFCNPIAQAACSRGPSSDDCQLACTASKFRCPTALVRLSGCAMQFDKHWTCREDGRPIVAGGCDLEQACFGLCVDSLPKPP